MKRMKFDWLMLVLTFIFSAIAVSVCLATREEWVSDEVSEVVWSAMIMTLPLVFSLIGVSVTEAIHSNTYIIKRKGNRAVSFIVAIIASILLGVGGQLAFNILVDGEYEEYVVPAEEMESEAIEYINANVSVVLDYSHSMAEHIEVTKEGVDDLLDALDEDDNGQIITFATKTFEVSDMERLTKSNKKQLKAVYENSFHTGASNAEESFEIAYEALTQDGENDKKALVLFSDGDIKISDEIKRKYLEEDISVYVIGPEGMENKLSDFVKATGGFSFEFEDEAEIDELVKALESKNYTVTIETKKEETKERYIEDEATSVIFGRENMSVAKFMVRLLMLILYALMATGVMYYTVSSGTLLSSVIVGILASILLLIAGEMWVFVGLVYVLLFYTAFTRYYHIN